MSIIDDAPRYCPYCDNELTLDMTPSSQNNIDGYDIAVYCEHCEYDFWLDLGFEATNDEDFDYYDNADEFDYDNDSNYDDEFDYDNDSDSDDEFDYDNDSDSDDEFDYNNDLDSDEPVNWQGYGEYWDK